MRSHFRTIVVLLVAGGLVALFLRNVDLRRVGADIVRARPEWLALGLASTFLNVAIRAYRWRYLLEPIGPASFGQSFRATAVGFAASTVLPARAGEVIRPYFLARTMPPDRPVSATGAFATIIVERVLDVVTVLVLLASYVFVFGRSFKATNPVAFGWLAGVAGTAAAVAMTALVVMFALAGRPERLGRATARLARVAPSLAAAIAHAVDKFAAGLGVVRRPARLAVALLWSFPLWLSIAAGIWLVARAFALAIPFTGTFLVIALLVLGVAVPTPGAIGGFHAAFRYGATTFFGAPDDTAVGAAIVLHLLSVGPTLLLGLVFAAQAGLNVTQLSRVEPL